MFSSLFGVSVNISAWRLSPFCPSQNVIFLVQAVSKSLKTQADAEDQRPSVKDSDVAAVSVSQEEKMTTDSQHLLPSALRNVLESDGSKSQADDLTVQIRATKSEVGLSQDTSQLLLLRRL